VRTFFDLTVRRQSMEWFTCEAV